MRNRFFRLFSGPSGPLGSAAGGLMARRNGPLDDWAAVLLDLERAGFRDLKSVRREIRGERRTAILTRA